MLISPDKIKPNNLLIDVRSPSEYQRGHIRGAVNLPIFSDQERRDVGICYKHQGQAEAIELGLKLVKPKLHQWIKEANIQAQSRNVTVYCWRGGLRSKAMSWLLNQAGFKVERINGGYKAWRQHALAVIRNPRPFVALTGFTGVGKTEILHQLAEQGEQVLDLEAIAKHQGSAFAFESSQPTTEHFENLVADSLLQLDHNKTIWIEDESKSIGKVYLDHLFFTQLSCAPVVLVTRPYESRVQHLCNTYGQEPSMLIKGFNKIRKRLGGQYANAAITYIESGNLEAAAKIALGYYDNAYLNSMKRTNRKPALVISLKNKTFSQTASELIQWNKEILSKSQG